MDRGSGLWVSCGLLLVAACSPGPAPLASTEESRATRVGLSWSATDTMGSGRAWHGAAVLTDGRVLVSGGEVGSQTISSAEIYDPSLETWTPTAGMAVPRKRHRLTRLGDGRVVATGGAGSAATSVEVYDPTAGSWSGLPDGPFPFAEGHAAVLLGDGRLLVSADAARLALLDPSGPGVWASVPVSLSPGTPVTATLLSDGRVLIAGSVGHGFFDPTTDTLTTITDASTALVAAGHTATTLPGGDVLVVGGAVTGAPTLQAAIFQPSLARYVAVAGLAVARERHAAAVLGPGHALVVGGRDASGVALASAELFDVGSQSWLAAGDLDQGRWAMTASSLGDGRVLVAGGTVNDGGGFNRAELFDAPRAVGAACDGDSECETFFCADGVCCDSRCNGPCDACSSAAKGTGTDGTCGLRPEGTVCRDAVCQSASVIALAGRCDAAGTCLDGGTQTCAGDFACVGDACLTRCIGAEDCAPGFHCPGEICVPTRENGHPCTEARECQSGFCVDGACCDSACDGQCEACSGPGADPGRCIAIVGAPRGSRTACAGTGTCAGTCDGLEADACAYPAAGLPCGNHRCEGSVAWPETCDGRGACVAEPNEPCHPHACADGACLTPCSKGADCASGFACAAGECVPALGRCVDDEIWESPEGIRSTCSPYRCDANACPQTCDKTQDCLAGFVCDPGARGCVEIDRSAGSSDDGGCGCRAGGRGAGPNGALCVLLAGGLLAGRRRRLRGGTAKGAAGRPTIIARAFILRRAALTLVLWAMLGCSGERSAGPGGTEPDAASDSGARDASLPDASPPDGSATDVAPGGLRTESVHNLSLVEGFAVTLVGADVVVGGAKQGVEIEPCIERRDTSGDRVWEHCFALAGAVVVSLGSDAAGNVYAAGRDDVSPAAGLRGSSRIGARGFLASVDGDGIPRWYQETSESISALAIDSAGRVVATGSTGDATARQAFVLVTDLDGNEEFRAALGAPITPLASGNSVAVAADGSIFVVGNEHQDGFLVKLSTTGSEQFRVSFRGDGYDQLRAVALDTEGHVVVGGVASSGIDLGGGPVTLPSSAAFVASFDAADAAPHANFVHDASDVWSLAQGGGTLFAVGAWGSDAFVLALDADLAVHGELTFGAQSSGSTSDDASAVAASPDGRVAVTGTFERGAAQRAYLARIGR